MDDRILQLSDAFAPDLDAGEADIQVRVRMININYGKNESVLSSCRPLKEYAWLVARIRENQQAMGIEEAVDKTIREEGDLRRARKTASNMKKRGVPVEEITEILELPTSMVRSW